jgi:hypothetical protein
MTFPAEADFAIERSASAAATVTAAVEVLFAAFGSPVALVIVAVFEIVPGAVADVFRTSVKVALPAEANAAIVHVTAPVPPAGGVAQVNTGPALCVIETNVVLAGSASLSDTFCACEGPLFVAAIVYVTSAPAVTAIAVGVFVIARSALEAATAVVVVALLFAGFGSAVALVIVTMFDSVPDAPFGVSSTSVKVALAAAASVEIVQVTGPVPPTGGVVHVKAGPVFCDIEANVLLAGTGSLSETVCASDGPLFVATIVNVAV